jgi:hypothetical protein
MYTVPQDISYYWNRVMTRIQNKLSDHKDKPLQLNVFHNSQSSPLQNSTQDKYSQAPFEMCHKSQR